MAPSPQPTERCIALGTAQWGTPYGIANRTGRPGRAELERILELAQASGVTTLDTARAYGDAEALIGELLQGSSAFRIVTKVSPTVVGADPGQGNRSMVRDGTLRSVEESLALLRRSRVDVILLHRGEQLRAEGGAAFAALKELQKGGAVDRIGASATTVAEALWLVEAEGIEALQVPASLADRRLVRGGFFARARERGVEIFVRSVLLQGAAALPPEALPSGLQPLAAVQGPVRAMAERLGVSPVSLWLSYARRRLDGTLLLGCETAKQLESCLRYLELPTLSDDELEALLASLPKLPDDVLDPSRWPR